MRNIYAAQTQHCMHMLAAMQCMHISTDNHQSVTVPPCNSVCAGMQMSLVGSQRSTGVQGSPQSRVCLSQTDMPHTIYYILPYSPLQSRHAKFCSQAQTAPSISAVMHCQKQPLWTNATLAACMPAASPAHAAASCIRKKHFHWLMSAQPC